MRSQTTIAALEDGAQKKSAERIAWIDIARGIGIILVVYGHVLRGLLGAHLFAESEPLWHSDYIIYTFHMPLFFVLAGLHVNQSLAKGRRRFFYNKLWTIAYPYLLWSVIQGSIQLMLPSYINMPRSLTFITTIFWHPIGQFWFLYVLFLCHMFSLIFSRHTWFIYSFAILSYILSLVFNGPFWGPILYMLPFYILGILLGNYVNNWHFSFRQALKYTIVFSILFSLSAYFGRTMSGGAVTSFFSLPAALLGISLTCTASQLILKASRWLSKVLISIGIMSMTIYILHVLAAGGTRIALKKMGIEDWHEQLMFGVIAGVALPVIAHEVFSRLGILGLLGLAPLKSRKSPMRTTYQWNTG